jgi:POT family proton-dependent oligopeptide transporter
MYDNEKYSNMRDSGFSLFYMFINAGAIFAPLAAIGVRNGWLGVHHYEYNADLPALCHGQLANTLTPEASELFYHLADLSSSTPIGDYSSFAADYLNVFTTGFHYAFLVAIGAMVISLLIYVFNKKHFPDPAVKTTVASTSQTITEMEAKEVKQRLYALIAVFGIVIFFWFSFHQNGLTLTFFAKEYTKLTFLGKSITVELFQSLNPFFVVCLTPIVMSVFAWQRARGKEPSTPKKIAIGMGIAALAYVMMTIGSYLSELPLHTDLVALGTSPVKVTPLLLMVTYLILTVAELYISPLGISFVSKVAPPKYQGVMQGGWLGATAIGNQLLFIGSVLYESIPIWMTWVVFVVACSISMITMLCMLKWLEKVAK